MNLEEFLFKYLHIGWGEVPPSDFQSHHTIIGTCGECNYKKNYDEEGGNICKHPDNDHVEDGFPDTFGCIHFKEKEEG